MKKIVVFTGAGISAESGISTFRDSNGLWENYNVKDVATLTGWRNNKQLVLDFYNERHKQMYAAQPNAAHYFLAELEKEYDVQLVTQNVDDLHERAGSTKVLHLHGELTKKRSYTTGKVYDWLEDEVLTLQTTCPDGWLLRPHIVWFEEQVPNMEIGEKYAQDADILVVIGTSLQVYPAANIVFCANTEIPVFYIDPKYLEIGVDFPQFESFTQIKEKASVGVNILKEMLDNIGK